jgi:hypothetical protein
MTHRCCNWCGAKLGLGLHWWGNYPFCKHNCLVAWRTAQLERMQRIRSVAGAPPIAGSTSSIHSYGEPATNSPLLSAPTVPDRR